MSGGSGAQCESVVKDKTTPDLVSTKDSQQGALTLLTKRFNITSDYESNDSPSSSDHSDHITGTEERARRPANIALEKVSVWSGRDISYFSLSKNLSSHYFNNI